MITFYPGPSKIYPQIAGYLQDAVEEGILSQNHRSPAFMDMLKSSIDLFKQKLNIPDNYNVYFTSSATECWEVIAQSFSAKGSLHIYNGAFGQKWFEYSQKIVGDNTFDIPFDFEASIPVLETDTSKYDVLCVTQNETSNGTQVNLNHIPSDEALIAFDVTSSIGGIALDWTKGDIWLASVQKCLGLPAGLGIMICSPKAIRQAEIIGERKHYNSFLFIHQNFEKFQTHYTPNVLAIYLLKRVMEQVENIELISKKIKARNLDFCQFIERETVWQLLIDNEAVRSDTVIAVGGVGDAIKLVKQKTREAEITLGNGYGNWKDTTFRIANFPAIEDWEFEALKTCLV
ncbi:aminotransferase class V-fold PLP-dependent enzyme [Emticicia sp. BO119]|uniref:aminotransferase class V-fold PLP-dependent enzyme n=1 Tax=Emticicia sp. BO119 TaxID=2757768 RepID=UPI0015F11419|nr:aminotransferase class V-fold PLP-dependent enzyme [Emticicia sp. BO119]MBA4849817.1 aminotransferase class V-fold PLP-dependent enzyme [Emticicia sp. BO119]